MGNCPRQFAPLAICRRSVAHRIAKIRPGILPMAPASRPKRSARCVGKISKIAAARFACQPTIWHLKIQSCPWEEVKTQRDSYGSPGPPPPCPYEPQVFWPLPARKCLRQSRLARCFNASPLKLILPNGEARGRLLPTCSFRGIRPSVSSFFYLKKAKNKVSYNYQKSGFRN